MGSKALGFTVEQENLIWDLHRRGESIREIERVLGETMPRIRRFLRESGGIRPVPRTRRIGHITAGEREEISRGIAADDSARTIADKLGRSPSTIAREIARNGGRLAYRAAPADAAVYVRARRPKTSILCARPILRIVITDKLHEQWSPQQISVWLRREYPADPQMWVSHETIYRCLFRTVAESVRQHCISRTAYRSSDSSTSREETLPRSWADTKYGLDRSSRSCGKRS